MAEVRQNALSRRFAGRRCRPGRRLFLAAARRAVAADDFAVEVSEAARAVEIFGLAHELQRPVSQVSRWVARGRAIEDYRRRGLVGRTAYEVAQRYAVGEIDRGRMIRLLSAWPEGPATPDADAWWPFGTPVVDDFDVVLGRALLDELISVEDFQEISAHRG